MDDADEKIRRNLILVASGIILAAWLELPGAILLGNLVSTSFEISQHKLWAVGFALLAYLSWRYRFSQEGQSLVDDLRQATMQGINEARWTDANRAADKYSRKGIFSPVLKDLQEVIDVAWKQTPSHPDGELERPMLRLSNFESGTDGLIFGARLSLQWPGFDQYSSPAASVGIRFNFEGGRLAWIALRGNARAWFYSEAAAQKLAPVLIAFTAEVVLWIRLLRAYWVT